MFASATTMIKDVGIFAARFLEHTGQQRHVLEAPL
jgi:hypothetical protein